MTHARIDLTSPAPRSPLDAALTSVGSVAQLAAVMPGALYVYDLAARTTVFVNRAPARLLGYTEADVADLGDRLMPRVLHPDDLPGYRAHLLRVAELADGATASVEYRLMHRQGDWRWFHSCDTVYARDADGRARSLLGVATDITDQHRARAARAESESQLREVFSSIDEGFCVCEMIVGEDGLATDYRFLDVNPLFESMTGLVGAVGRTALELVPDLEPEWVQTYAMVGLGRETRRFQQGSAAMGRFFDVFAMPLSAYGRFAVVFKDVSEQRSAELALRTAARADHLRASLGDELRLLDDPRAVQETGARLLREHLEALRVQYAEVDQAAVWADVRAEHTDGGPVLLGRHRLADHGVEVLASFRSGEDVVVDDVATDPRLSPEQRATTLGVGVGSYLLVVLRRVDQPVALLVVHHAAAHVWTDDERLLVHEAADRIWAAVQRVEAERTLRDNEAAERRGRRRAERLAGLLTELGDVDSEQALTRRLVDVLVRDVADCARVELEGAPPVVACAPGAGDHTGHVHDDELDLPLDLGVAAGRLVLAVVGRPPLDEDDVAFAQDVADRAGLALARARLREAERDVSVRLQRALLPDSLQQHPALAVDAHYDAAHALLQVGGDWYDTFAWPDGSVGAVVGDVMGHDLQAAAAMGRLRAGVRAVVTRLPPGPRSVLQALDLCTEGPDGAEFVTAFAVVVDPATGVLRYASAGHPPALLLVPGQEPVWLEEATSPPAGALGQVGPRPEQEVQLSPGATVVLYSDGLVERRGEHLDEGLARLSAAATRAVSPPSGVLAARLAEELGRGSAVEDDVVVLTLTWSPVV